jgi:chromosome segregation ATPase
MNGNGVPTAALPMRVVLREVSTNTELNLEKAILDRETLLLEKQATSLAREQEFLRRETEFFAKEKEQQETIRQLQSELTSALERIAKLETQATQTTHEWEAKLQEVIHSREEDTKVEITHMAQLKQLQHEVERLQCTNESLSAELSSKDNLIFQLREDSSRTHLEEAASVQHARANVTALEAALKETEDRWRYQEGQLKSQQAAHAAKVETLSQQVSRLDLGHKAQAKQIEETEKRLHDMKTSRDHFREECLHKDDELYRLKKALLHKSEEVEEVRVQLMKAAERQDRMQQQQQQLYDKQLQASIVQLEMEFRREHHQATEKLQVAYRKYQETLRQLQRFKGSYESSLKREALLKEEVHRLSAIIEGDKEKLVDQELTKRAEYEFKIKRLQDETRGLQDELVAAREETARVSALQHELEESRLEIDRLSGEMKRVEVVVQTFGVKEGDWKAALKVKDTMLNDQMRQLDELRKQLKTLEDAYQHDTGELEARIEDLEEALDESLEKISRLQEKYDRAKAALAENEDESTKHRGKMDDMAKEIELKNAALELIEGEMSRMRDTLSKQDGIFQKRLQRYLEQHREEMERTRVSVEETNTKLRVELEEQQAAMTQKYDKLADDLKDMAAQNTKLRVTLDQERKKNLQSDREMRVLLAQVRGGRIAGIRRDF